MEYLVEMHLGRLVPLNMTVNPDLAPETFCLWADSRLKSSEITALWETWKPVFQEGNWFVFPIPEEHHHLISEISLETNREGEVTYSRLFLGAVRMDPL